MKNQSGVTLVGETTGGVANPRGGHGLSATLMSNLPKIGEYERPHFISFDIYGTVLHWFDGLADSLKAYDVKLDKDLFDQIKDFQGQAERESFRPYSEITAESLIQIVGLSKVAAEDIAKDCWRWPLFGDSQRGCKR